jgi:Ni/Co efflux regulator RcnB
MEGARRGPYPPGVIGGLDLRRALLAALIVAAAALAGPARAQPRPWVGGPLKDKSEVSEDSASLADRNAKLTIHEREVVRLYFVDQHGRGKCPEGLTKKEHACLPAGQAKKRYAVGQALSPLVVTGPIPIGLANRLGAPPRGYRYAIVDGDLVKLATGSQVVVDAVESLVE